MYPYLFGAVALCAGVALLLFFAAKSAEPPRIMTLGTSFFFWLGMGYLMLLLLVAGAYVGLYKHPQPYLIRGLLPVAVPWFGALGAVMISLEGVFLKNDQWNAKFNYWHIGRPIFGAVLGIVSFFLYIVIISASGTKPNFLLAGQTGSNALDFIVFYMVAFLVGYRETTFRELMKRVTDLILKPASSSPQAPALVFRQKGQPVQGVTFPPAAVGTPVPQSLELCNTGNAPLRGPVLEISAPEPAAGLFTLLKDPVTHGGDLAPGETRTVELSFKAAAAQGYAAVLKVKADNLAAPRTLPLSGTGS
jgi:hypothetical protein